MISVITRCRNRLEYTAQVMDAVKRNTEIDYEHIIIDNASEDGTQQWFHWMAENSWYKNIKYYRMPRNVGDWGGMLAGFKQAKGDFIVQLDNDIIPCNGWLRYLHLALRETEYQVMMLRRESCKGKWILQPLSPVRNVGALEVVKVERAVACYMMAREDFEILANRIPERLGLKSKYIMAKHLKIGKVWNRTCIEIEAEDQRMKYNPKNPQIWEKV